MMNTYNNPVLEHLPKHLQQYVVEQNYKRYSAMDQAIWRYVMRQNYAYLKDIAYYPYIPGLTKAGLTIERIPNLQVMNDSLMTIGWGAVTVDGFIPPAAFMEFQANCVLVIAADIRQIEHITYTPAPDIIHESSGHAPIIGEPEYAAYLQYFGEVGSKALSSSKDFELYEAIRTLSIVKEKENASEQEIQIATDRCLEIASNMGEPSEMALLSRLHWWTVEYGLIGSVKDYKIYGAGLLSSIGESATCMSQDVKKLIYDIDTVQYSYDITKPQPQLFVTPDFKHAYKVLDEFAEGMAFRTGGIRAVEKAINSKNVCTVVLSSGLQISGIFTSFLLDKELIAIKTIHPTALAYHNKELQGHGKEVHMDGFSSPVGVLKGKGGSLEECNIEGLKELGIEIGMTSTLYFQSGIMVKGKVKDFLFGESGKILIISFDECSVIHEPSETIIFQPEWGIYDMAVGSEVSSVYAGAADKYAFEPHAAISKVKTEKRLFSDKQKELHQLYHHIRIYREKGNSEYNLLEFFNILRAEFANDWLAMVELYELAIKQGEAVLQLALEKEMDEKVRNNPDLKKLISDGIHLAKTQPINLELDYQ